MRAFEFLKKAKCPARRNVQVQFKYAVDTLLRAINKGSILDKDHCEFVQGRLESIATHLAFDSEEFMAAIQDLAMYIDSRTSNEIL